MLFLPYRKHTGFIFCVNIAQGKSFIKRLFLPTIWRDVCKIREIMLFFITHILLWSNYAGNL
jgi:hypothetical protein